MKFVQLVEYSTTRIDEVREAAEQMQAEAGGSPAGARVLACADRDTPNRYVTVVEFDSYEQAMENSNRPEITAFAAKMAELCDEPPTYRNLDVAEIWGG